MQDRNSKKDVEAALRAENEERRKHEAVSSDLETENKPTDSAFDQEPLSREGDGKVHAIGPAPGVRPPVSDTTNPQRPAPHRSTPEPAAGAGTGKVARWAIGVLVAILVLWLLLGLFG